MRYILTILPTLKKSAFNELKEIDKEISIKNLDSYIFLAETATDLKKNLKKSIYIRHMHRIDKEFTLTGERKKDLKKIQSNLDFFNISDKKFMVQCRKIGKALPYNSKDIEVFIGSYLESKGGKAIFDDKQLISNPSLYIVSILVFNDKCYLGFAKQNENLEPYADPARIYSKWKNSISRAEFKLREAIRKFDIKLKKGMNALDLGAAPGGWSQILLDYGLNVTAIDPADLDERLQKIEHFKGKAEDFDTNTKFDILVNDMNMDPRDSAKITISMKKFLKKSAKIIFTAKLVTKNYEKLITDTIKIFENHFKIIAIKNLFHNHEEVTFYMEAKA